MIELRSLERRPKISLKFVWFMFLGAVLLVSDFEIGRLVEPLPRWLGGIIFAGDFGIGMFLLFGSILFPSLTRVKPAELARTYVDQVEKWELSGELVLMIEGLSRNETLGLVEMIGKLVGEDTSIFRITPKYYLRMGFKILPTGYDGGRPLFSVILYRRDLAKLKGIRRPWRKISHRDGTVQFIKPSRLVGLPSWIT